MYLHYIAANFPIGLVINHPDEIFMDNYYKFILIVIKNWRLLPAL